MSRVYNILVLMCISVSVASSQSSHKLLLNGDDHYTVENFESAEEYYRKAREKERSLKSEYNLGNTTYKQERFEEAAEHFQSAINLAKNNADRSKAYYNLGNSLFENQQFEEAASAFKEAIKLDPDNSEARYNLAVTRQALRMMQQQEQQQQQNQDNNNQEENKEENNQEQNDQQNNNQEQQQNQQEEQEQQQQEQSDSLNMNNSTSFDSTRLEKQELDSIDARKLLEIIQNEELKVQEKMRKFNSKRKRPVKDW